MALLYRFQQKWEVISLAILTGKKPAGWYTGRRSEHTRDLLREMGGFLYDSDSYADDVPYFIADHLVIPYLNISPK